MNDKKVSYLRETSTIRNHCQQVFSQVEKGKGLFFRLDLSKLESVSLFVAKIIQENYPDLEIPVHSRWRHFSAGGDDRQKKFCDFFAKKPKEQLAEAAIGLTVLSVFLDAGAGSLWKYQDEMSKKTYRSSEGLAVASYQMVASGEFHFDKKPWVIQGEKLKSISLEQLAKSFQVSKENPIEGLEGRLHILHKLGSVLKRQKQEEGFHWFLKQVFAKSVSGKIEAQDLLLCVLESFSEVWPSGLTVGSKNMGDIGVYKGVKGKFSSEDLVPFHKLSQWLTYSLIEPLSFCNLEVIATENLTGLPEYRNGGLFLDTGVIELIDHSNFNRKHRLDDALVVEWRALTVILLDLVAKNLSNHFGKKLTLGQVLQGGTWLAGRSLAKRLRENGSPPLLLDSDGSIF